MPIQKSADKESAEKPQADSAHNEPSAISPRQGIPVAPVSISSTESDASPPAAIPEGFSPLFAGQDMAGWEVIDGKADSWEYKDGVVSCVAPGGGWIQTLAMYSDFELRFEYRLSPRGNSGVSLRYPGHGNPSLEGLEIQLIDDQAEKYKDIQPEQATGSLYFAAAPQVRDAALPAGTWNHCAVRCAGQRLEVSINDKLVNEIDLTQINTKVEGVPHTVAAIRSPMGAIALQSHVTRVDFRQIVLRDLTQALTSGVRWLDLQDGTGDAVPAGANVTVHYIGHLSTGKRFANSIEKDKPVTVDLRDVIPGWREGIPGMKVGGKRRLVVPPAMAYGDKGFKEVVPPNSTLVYEIELLGFEPAEDEVPLESADASPAETEVK
jgi:peptidylprolyl isomerase